jgi:RNA recognition motif-containing protein
MFLQNKNKVYDVSSIVVGDFANKTSVAKKSRSVALRSDNPLMTIYIGNLSYQATPDDLKAVFAEYGDVKRVVLPTDRETGRMRGFAFVEMTEDAQEDAAIAELDGAEWMGRQLRVNKAKPKEEGRG